jgi:hypothetical protein
MTEGNKGLFNFVGLNKGNERKFHVEIHGFEKDLQNLRSTVLPLFFDIPNLFKINDRPITRKPLTEFDGIYAVTMFTKNGISLPEGDLSKLKAFFLNGKKDKLLSGYDDTNSSSSLVIQNGEKDTRYQFKIDPTNKLIDIFDEKESVIPSLSLFDTKNNQIQINFLSSGKIRPSHLSTNPAADLTTLEFRRMIPPKVDFKVVSPMTDLVLVDKIVINAQLSDPENGNSYMEYRFGGEKWKLIKSEPRKIVPTQIQLDKLLLGEHTFSIRGYSDRGGGSNEIGNKFDVGVPLNWTGNTVIPIGTSLKSPFVSFKTKMNLKRSENTSSSFVSRGPALNYDGDFIFISESNKKEYPYYISRFCVDKHPNSSGNYNYLMMVSHKAGAKLDYKAGASLDYWYEFKGEIDGARGKIVGKNFL